jgi:hypothetical protein
MPWARKPALLLFLLSLIILITARAARPAFALITSVSVSPNPVTSTGLATITLLAQETDGSNGPISLSVASGTLQLTKCQTSDTSTCTTVDKAGDNTSSVTINKATDGDANAGEPLTLAFLFTPPTVTAPSAVTISGCQGPGCAATPLGAVVVNPAGVVGGADEIIVTASVKITTCGSSVSVSAGVAGGGSPVPDGTQVLFTTGIASGVFPALTAGGSATTTITVPLGFAGSLVITASSGSAAGQVAVEVSCSAAGPPAQLSVTLAPDTISCGSSASILVKVSDQFAHAVTNGTAVGFAATLGSIVPSAPTTGGLAQSVLTSASNRPGIATITVTAGTISSQVLLQIRCATPTSSPAPTPVSPSPVATEVPATVLPPPPVVATVTVPTIISPPNTGDGGIANR